MTRQHRSQSNSVSLFPFLAVLICAMGALIFLLIVNTRRIRVQAIQRAFSAQIEQTETEPIIVDLPDEPVLESLVLTESDIEEIQEPAFSKPSKPSIDFTAIWNEKIAALELSRNNQRKTLVDQNARLQQVKQSLLNSKSRLQRLEHKNRTMTKDSEVLLSSEKRLLAEKERIVADVLNVHAQIDALKRRQVQQSSKFSIIPYEGRSGTTYRPIYIECTSTGIRFLPEDVVIHASDLEGFTEKLNPLLSGTKALVHFWTAWDRVENSNGSAEPYVLLLVRPSGSVAYYVAKRYLQKIGTRHGYELIDQDWELDLPDVNPQARSACQQAVDNLIARRAQFAKKITGPRNFLSNGDDFELSKRSAGPFGDDRNRNRPRRLSASAAQNATSIHPTEVLLPNRDTGNTNSKGKFSEFDADPKNRNQNNLTNRTAKAFSTGNSASQNNKFFNQPLSKRSELVEDGKFSSPGQHKSPAISKAPTYNQKRIEPGSGQISSFNLTPNTFQQGEEKDPAEPKSQESRNSAGQLTESNLFPADSNRNGSSGTQADQLYKVNVERQKPSHDQSRSGSKPLVQDFPIRRGDSPATGSSLKNSTPRQLETAGTIGKSFSASSGRTPSSRSTKKRRWGNPSPNATIGFEKEMTIVVTGSRIVIGGEYVLPLNGRNPPADMVEQVIQAIELTARSWERAPEGFYWVPSVKFEVDPAANHYFDRLEKPIRKLGIVSSVNYSTKLYTPTTESE